MKTSRCPATTMITRALQSRTTIFRDRSTTPQRSLAHWTTSRSPRFELRGGTRYTYDRKRFDVTSAYNQTFAATSATVTGHNVSGDLSATYTVVPNVNLYARVATGFRAPSFGVPSATTNIQVAQAETNTSEEVGVKSFLLDRRIRLDADIYYYDVRHQQLTAVGGTDNATRLLNAAKTIGDGAEINFEADLTQHLTFAVAASYNFTRDRGSDAFGGCLPRLYCHQSAERGGQRRNQWESAAAGAEVHG